MIQLSRHNFIRILIVNLIMSFIVAIYTVFVIDLHDGGSWSLLGASLNLAVVTLSYLPLGILGGYLEL